MIQAMVHRRTPLAIVTFAVACAAIVAMMILLSSHTNFTVFIPLFAPAGLASWAIYRSGTGLKPSDSVRDHRPLLLVILTLAALVWCVAFLI